MFGLLIASRDDTRGRHPTSPTRAVGQRATACDSRLKDRVAIDHPSLCLSGSDIGTASDQPVRGEPLKYCGLPKESCAFTAS